MTAEWPAAVDPSPAANAARVEMALRDLRTQLVSINELLEGFAERYGGMRVSDAESAVLLGTQQVAWALIDTVGVIGAVVVAECARAAANRSNQSRF